MTSKKTSSGHVHFIGIGGIGISALARYFFAQNWTVSGSDSFRSELTRELAAEGIRVKIGHAAANVPQGTTLVIYSNAVPETNPERIAARDRKIKAETYPEALGKLTQAYTTIAVAGSHGKSTTTALVALILMKAGLDPTVIVGTKLRELGGKNFRLGKGKYLIIEADEYKGAFWNYAFDHAIITNVDREHLDFYAGLPDVKKSFVRFAKNVRSGGALVCNAADRNLASLKARMPKSAHVEWYDATANVRKARLLAANLRIPGAHNVSNALAALTVAKRIGISEKVALEALASYRGSWRRMEDRGAFRDDAAYRVYDDYGHHPSEIAATLEAFRSADPAGFLICVFQPHQEKRLTALFKEFARSFHEADALILLDAYTVAGRDVVAHSGAKSAQDLALAVTKEKERPGFIAHLPSSPGMGRLLRKELRELVRMIARAHRAKGNASGSIVMMGAGDIVNHTAALL